MIEDLIEISKKAGEEIMRIYDTDFSIEQKKDNSPLTEADIAAHNIIKSSLEKFNIPILSEEGKSIPYEKRKDWKQFFLVDPIDGTKEFIKKSGKFTVNIALIDQGIPIMGVVYAPAIKTLYYSDGKKSFKKVGDERARVIHARELPEKERIIVCSLNHCNQETKDYIASIAKDYNTTTTSIGSSLKLCLIAEGKADIYPRLGPTMEWDTAAAHAVVLTAGAHAFQYETQLELEYNKENLQNPNFIVKK